VEKIYRAIVLLPGQYFQVGGN